MQELAGLFKALGDENRLKIIDMLSKGERCVCHIYEELNLAQPTISHHLKILKQAGLVKIKKHGKWVCYSLEEKAFRKYQEFFARLLEHFYQTETAEGEACCRECPDPQD